MTKNAGSIQLEDHSKYHGLEMRVLGAGTLREREDVVLQKDDRTRDVAHRPIPRPVFTGHCGQAVSRSSRDLIHNLIGHLQASS